MEAGRSLLVGIDLCDDMAQISYYDKKIYEPVPVGIPVGDKYIYEIPSAVLFFILQDVLNLKRKNIRKRQQISAASMVLTV